MTASISTRGSEAGPRMVHARLGIEVSPGCLTSSATTMSPSAAPPSAPFGTRIGTVTVKTKGRVTNKGLEV